MITGSKIQVFDNDRLMQSSLKETLEKCPPVCMINLQYTKNHCDCPDGENYAEIAELIRQIIEVQQLPVILYDTNPLSKLHLHKQFEFMDLLYKYKRVSYFRTPFSFGEIAKEILWMYALPNIEDKVMSSLYDMEIKQSSSGRLLHDMLQRPEESVREVNKIYMTNFDPNTDQNKAKEFLKNYKRECSEFFVDKELPGVFCEIAGVLIHKSGKINKRVFSALKKYDHGKFITLWTGGDIDRYRKELPERGINWKILPKLLFTGTTVEIAIDDTIPDDLLKQYGIKIKNFIHTNNI